MVTCIFATTSLIDLGEEEFEEESWRLLQSEHGATLDLADRISVVNEIPLDRLAEVIPLPHYSLTKDTTWDYLLSGSNYDYSTSRAMDAARYERTKESGLHRDWLERAKEQLELAQQNDSVNAPAIRRTIMRRTPPLASKWLAVLDITNRP